MISGRFYTLQEVCDLLGGISPQRAHQLAAEQDIEKHSGAFFNAADVTEYVWGRARRDLACEMGIYVREPVYHDDWDLDCPICGAFAIWRPAEPDEISNTELPVYEPGWPWRCVKGHNSESEEKCIQSLKETILKSRNLA